MNEPDGRSVVDAAEPWLDSESDASTEQARTPQEKRINFNDGNRTVHVQALYAWLPAELRSAPGIDWSAVPSKTIGYLVRTVGKSPDAACIALAVGTTVGAVSDYTHVQMTKHLHGLLKDLRSACGIEDLSQLAQRAVWDTYATKIPLSRMREKRLRTYSALTELHVRHYLERLDPPQRGQMQQYALPRLPPRFLKIHGGQNTLAAQSQRNRKERSDILLPLYPVLVALVQLRKQVAERMLHAFHEACKRAEAGEALPLRFSYEERIPGVNRDARTISEVRLEGRPVTMKFVLWDRRTWVRQHSERYSETVRREADQGSAAYDQAHNSFFLQFDGPSGDLLWFGDLVEHRLLQFFRKDGPDTAEYRARWRMARELGATNGFSCNRPGLLTPPATFGRWLHDHRRSDELLFEPQSLYRGILYGAALTMIALTNGSRVSELLQVSLDRFRTRTETIQVTRDGKTTPRRIKIYLQLLLPKGSLREEQRQLFPVSRQSVKLLREIHEGLIQAHGGTVPIVLPSSRSAKFEHLQPERYLFQWAASVDGRLGTLSLEDVTILMRFVLHGLELSTAKGEPILVSAHLLRHVTATVARHDYGVPPEAIAWVLHHRERAGEMSSEISIPSATAYYTLEPEEKRLVTISAFQLAVEEQAAALELSVPDERDLEQMDEDMRAVFERWGTILPTAFGNCGCPGLCIRGDQRSLCIGCPYLVVDPAKMAAALKWRDAYAVLAAELEAEGNLRDAKQKRQLVRQLDGHMSMMRLQQQAEEDGRSLPFLRKLRSPQACAGEANDGEL